VERAISVADRAPSVPVQCPVSLRLARNDSVGWGGPHQSLSVQVDPGSREVTQHFMVESRPRAAPVSRTRTHQGQRCL